MTTVLRRFMSTATAILYEHDRKTAHADQPPFFVRTTWLFAELEELADLSELPIFSAMKVARLRQNVAGAAKLLELIEANNGIIRDGRRQYERRQLCLWIREQIKRESAPCQ